MRILLLMAGALLLGSCQKEVDAPQPTAVEQINPHCLCGVVLSSGMSNGYYINVVNNCSGNVKRFNVSWEDYVAKEYCTIDNKTW
jgi:hypothetical protein